MSIEDDKLDELLARGHLSGPQYDAVLDRVLARTETREPRRAAGRWLRWTLVPGMAIASGVAAWLLVARPAPEPFAAKGAPTTSAANGALQIGCAPAGDHVCRAGSTLMFTVNSALASGSLGAYAERVGDSSRERIWYFPTARGTSPTIARGTGTVVVPDGIRIGAEHPPGHYRVTVWLAARPLGRGEVDSAGRGEIRSRAVLDLEVVP